MAAWAINVMVLALSTSVVVGNKRVSTTCTSEACFTLHLSEKNFQEASNYCINNGGNLITLRNDKEIESVKSALLETGKHSVPDSRLWIGLELPKGRCTDFTEHLCGFQWTSGPTDSKYARWKKEPLSTCTENRCVTVSLADDLKWTDGSCRENALFMCKFLFKGMCKPILLDQTGDVRYTLPFLLEQPTRNKRLVMLPHGTWAEIKCSDKLEFVISICDSKNGHFGWSNQERACVMSERRCARKNGGCDHLCSDHAGDVRCACREGFHLMDDQVSCAVPDRCANSSCQMSCVPTSTGFSCACADGYRLAGDGVHCVDIDECIWNVCGEHGCQNTLGSFYCDCQPGFRLSAGKCEDVDECAESSCNQGCLNSQGSFSCYCHSGYISSPDGGGCVDIDECLSRPCEDMCLNTLGSYKCSCGLNFILAENGISCVPVRTANPQNSPTSSDVHQETPGTDGPTTATIKAPSRNNTNPQSDSSKRTESFIRSYWLLLCILGSSFPVLLLFVVLSVFGVYRWRRSRKTTSENATADNYCWVSSGLENIEKVPH